MQGDVRDCARQRSCLRIPIPLAAGALANYGDGSHELARGEFL